MLKAAKIISVTVMVAYMFYSFIPGRLLCPIINLGIPTHIVHQLATYLHCHAIKSLNKITKTRHKIHFSNNNSDNGGSAGRGVTGRAAVFRRARRKPDRMADNPPDPH